VLVSLDGTRATLEVEVVRSPALPTGLSANVVAPPVTALDNLTLLVRARISAQSKDAVMATSPLRAELAHILSLGLIEVLPRDALDTRRLDGTRSSCIFGEE